MHFWEFETIFTIYTLIRASFKRTGDSFETRKCTPIIELTLLLRLLGNVNPRTRTSPFESYNVYVISGKTLWAAIIIDRVISLQFLESLTDVQTEILNVASSSFTVQVPPPPPPNHMGLNLFVNNANAKRGGGGLGYSGWMD